MEKKDVKTIDDLMNFAEERDSARQKENPELRRNQGVDWVIIREHRERERPGRRR